MTHQPNYDMGLPRPNAGTELEACEFCKQLTIAKDAPKDTICYKCGLWKGHAYQTVTLRPHTLWIEAPQQVLEDGWIEYLSKEWLWRNGDYATMYYKKDHEVEIDIGDITISLPIYTYGDLTIFELADKVCQGFCERVPLLK
jgi:hypothetical protein